MCLLPETENDFPDSFSAYLQASDIIDWQHPAIVDRARKLAAAGDTPIVIAQLCFEWVRDHIAHSVDYQRNPVTCRASEVLHHQTGFCFAKSHLLAALLRANRIPTGFCYQRLSINDNGPPYSLHGFNAVYLPEIGWYRIDPRGNKPGIDAQFLPPREQMAYAIRLPGEMDFQSIWVAPLPIVVHALERYTTWQELRNHLPDLIEPDLAAVATTSDAPASGQ